MSNLTADTLMPLFSALPEEQQHVFAEKIRKLLKPRVPGKRNRKDIFDVIGDKYRPENREILISEIMNGK
jgi:hypothetical protein